MKLTHSLGLATSLLLSGCGSEPPVLESHSADPAIDPAPAVDGYGAEGTVTIEQAVTSSSKWENFKSMFKESMKDAEDVLKAYKTAKDVIDAAKSLAAYMGIMDIKSDTQLLIESIDALGLDLSKQVIGTQILDHAENMESTLRIVQQYDATNSSYTRDSPGYYESVDAVTFVGSEGASRRRNSSVGSEGPPISVNSWTGTWMNAMKDRPYVDANNAVYDWRLAVPTFLKLIGERLAVISHLDANFRTDHTFDGEFRGIRKDLLYHYNTMMDGIRCTSVQLLGLWWADNGTCTDNQTYVMQICADIYSGANASFVNQDCSWFTNPNQASAVAMRERLADEVRAQTPIAQVRNAIGQMNSYIDAQSSSVDLAVWHPSNASSNWNGNFSADKAFDGNSATGWSASGSDSWPWIVVDLWEPRSVGWIEVVTRQDYDQPETRRNFEIWGTNDGSQSWIVLGSQGSVSAPYRSIIQFALKDISPYRYIALVKTAPEYFFVSDIRIHSELDDYAKRSTVFASSSNPETTAASVIDINGVFGPILTKVTYEPKNTIDGISGTGWFPATANGWNWIEYDLGEPVALSRIQLTPYKSVFGAPSWTGNFEIRASNVADMSYNYTVLYRRGSEPMSDVTTLPINNSAAYRYIAINKTVVEAFGLNEIKMYH